MKRPPFARINQYRILWVFVFFDLPTETKKDKRHYKWFLDSLKEDGFVRLQYSIYIRHSSSRENAEKHMNRVRMNMPPRGQVVIFTITDRQFADMEFFEGPKHTKRPETPQQLTLFE